MNDRQIQKMLLFLVLGISLLLLPLQVFGDTGDEICGKDAESKGFLVPMNYEGNVFVEDHEGAHTAYILSGVENDSKEEDTFRFLLPKEGQSVIMTIENLTVRRNEEASGTAPVQCDFRLVLESLERSSSEEAVVVISKEPLPSVRVYGNTGIALRYAWYEPGGNCSTPLWPEVNEHFTPVAPNLDVVPAATQEPVEEKVEKKENDDQINKPDKKTEHDHRNDKEKKDETLTDTAEVTETETAETTDSKDTEDTKDHHEPRKRAQLTTISKPMNHVKLVGKLPKGSKEIEESSLRVSHNGTDITDNCIIEMQKDGFVVDTQMNTNRGDRFVTTYQTIPSEEDAPDNPAQIYTEEHRGEVVSDASPILKQAETSHEIENKPEVPIRGIVIVPAILLLCAGCFLLIRSKKSRKGKSCIQKNLNYGI